MFVEQFFPTGAPRRKRLGSTGVEFVPTPNPCLNLDTVVVVVVNEELRKDPEEVNRDQRNSNKDQPVNTRELKLQGD